MIVVSNRLPVHLNKTENGYETLKSVSGLATALDSVLTEKDGKWIGWAGEKAEVCEQNKDLLKDWEKERYFPIVIPDDILTHAHEEFNNSVLWTTFHGFIKYLYYEDKNWKAYQEFNQIYCDKIVEEYEGQTIWVQDFQLMLLPKMLKERIPGIKVGFFLHITFPTSDVFQLIPNGNKLIEGLLAADVIQFHTDKDVKNFLRSMNRVNVPRGNALVMANPIGIDPEMFENFLREEEVIEKAAWMKSCFHNKKIIMAAERLDFTKGIIERLRGFEYLLENYPELHGEITLVQIAASSRQSARIYRRLAEDVHKEVGRLNGRYGRLDWTPVYYDNEGWSQKDLAALYSVSDVACITPVVDGMNLVSKEYCVSEAELKDRALIISPFIGSAVELTDAFIVNPYHTEALGEQMAYSLFKGGEGMMSKLQEKVKANTVFDWVRRFKEAIEGV